MSTETLTLAFGGVVLLLAAVLFALTPSVPSGPCDLESLILCLELPVPSDRWSVALAADGLWTFHLVDFGFLIAYAGFLVGLARLRFPSSWIGASLAATAVVAALLDAAENVLILDALAAPDLAAPRFVFTAASLKFAALGLVTAALPWGSPATAAGWVERLVGLLALVLIATPIWREASLYGFLGLALGWLIALLRTGFAGLSRIRNGVARAEVGGS